MIPYDDLVTALSNWRARQGLPVSTLGKQPSGGTPVAMATPGSGPAPGSGPRTAPPMAPPRAPSPPPLAAQHDDVQEVEDAAMLDENAYENEGADFAMNFGGNAAADGEATSIGGAPERPTDPGRGGGEDW
jgi:hypothetical protein